MNFQIDEINVSLDELEEKLNSVKLTEYGVYQEFLTDKISNFLNEREKFNNKEEFEVIAAINNVDLVGKTLDLVVENIEEVVKGLNILSSVIKANKKVIIFPEYGNEFVSKIKDIIKDNNIELRTEFINVRKHTNDLIIHIISVMEVGQLFNDTYEDGVYVSVNGSKCKKYNSSLKICEIFKEENINLENSKAIEAGYSFYSLDNLDKTLAELNINNALLNTIENNECSIHKVEEKLLTYRKTSCGKCVFCREGLVQLQEMQKDIIDEKAKIEYVEIADEIASSMTFSNLCSLGQVSPRISLSSLNVFDKEYEDHIKKKTCAAGICYNKTLIYIDPVLCTGCEECLDVCPEDCIEGKKGYIHMLDEYDCTQCGKCIEVCSDDAILKINGKLPKLPDKLTKVGRFRRR